MEKIVEVSKNHWNIQEEIYSNKYTITKEGLILLADIHLRK